MSKELDNSIEIIKKVYQVLLLAKESLAYVVYASKDQYGEMTLMTLMNCVKNTHGFVG